MWARNIDSRSRTAKQLRFKSALVPIRLFQNPIPQLLLRRLLQHNLPTTEVVSLIQSPRRKCACWVGLHLKEDGEGHTGAPAEALEQRAKGSAWETSGAPEVPTPEAALRSVVLPLLNAFVKPIAVLKTRSSGPKIASAAPSRKNPLLQTEYGRFQRPAWIARHAGNIHGSVRSGFGA
jgi:hypothetical protein